MSGSIPITIIGGGLAGLSLGIGLRRHGVPVTVYEAGRYPRHRVCGEFISGSGAEVLDHLGLRSLLERAGMEWARTVVFHWAGKSSPVRTLPAPAVAISRFALDDLLARTFAKEGGDLRIGNTWREPLARPGIVQACGRASCPVEGRWRWYGLKVHARNVTLGADLEMHARADGYVGISRLPGNEVNICGLFRRPVARSGPAPPWRQTLRGPAGTRLHELLRKATLDEDSFCAVAGLGLRPRRARATGELRIGDALTMIPPITGNGMSMAFEAAALAIPYLLAYSRGEIDWDVAQRHIAAECNRRFACRLAWAKWLQRLVLSSHVPPRIVGLLLNSATIWRLFLRKTR